MVISRRSFIGTAGSTGVLPFRRVFAHTPTIKLGVLTDMSGPYRDLTGMNSVAGVRQAVDEFATAGKPLGVELISADHQNKPDVGEANDEWQLQHRYMQTEAMAELTPPLLEAIATQISTAAA